MDRTAPPRILLAEDDPVSRAFLAEALRRLGCAADVVEDGDAASLAAGSSPYDALILDQHLPGLHGEQVLRIERARGGPNRTTPAIATTAELDPGLHRRLREAGFAEVLLKPLAATRLREALRGIGLAIPPAVLDDEAGAAACGGGAALAALRGLFARELDALAPEWEDLQPDALAARLHRLRASCGLCGAPALQSAAAELADALRAGIPDRVTQRRAAFRQALAETRQAMQRGQQSAR